MDQENSPEALVARLVRLLTLTPKGEDEFAGNPQPGGVGRVYGGQVIAQALQATQASVTDGKVAHSLHAYFLRGGEEGPDIDYTVARDFDGRSFTNRRVIASQGSSPILNLTASFQRPESGLEHQSAEMPDVPDPDGLPSIAELRRKSLKNMSDKVLPSLKAMISRPNALEMRPTQPLHWMAKEPRPAQTRSWFRVVAPLPDDDDLHRAVIAYASDYTLLGTSVLPHGLSWLRGELVSASLDHTLWFHRPARADEWLLYSTDSPWSGGGRSFNRGQIFNLAGELVASVAQEGMIRRRQPKGD